MTAIIVIGIAGYVSVVAVYYFAQRTLLYPGASRTTGSALGSPPWGERALIATSDGETLSMLHAAAAGGQPTILFFHGNGDDIGAYGFLAKAFASKGVGMLAVSYRGYPGSSGSPSEEGLLTDGIAAFDWLHQHVEGPIFILGRSLGTGVAVNTAAEREANGLILVSPYESISAIARRRFPFLPVSLLIKDDFRSDLRIGRVSEPKLFFHGELDEIIPIADGRALFEAAAGPKRFVVAIGGGHNDVWTPDAIEQILEFVKNPAGATR